MSGQKRSDGFSRTQMSYRARDYESDYGNEDKISKVEGISRAFAKMTCINSNFQLKMIESSAFREFFGHLTPRFQLDTLESLLADCLKIYREERRKVKEILRNRDGQVSLSVEKLKSRDRNCYMCLAAHFLDDTWKMNRWVLLVWIATSYNLLVPVLKSLNYWEIEEKISSITFKTDTDIDIDETVDKVKDHIQKKKALWLNGHLFHVCCWTDVFNSMVWDAFDQISDTIDKIDEFENSKVLDSDDQHNATNQTQLKTDSVHDCINRGRTLPHWHLNYSRLKEALVLHARGDFSSQNMPHNYLLSADEWKKVEVICKLVDKLKNIERILFDTKHINASILLSNLLELHVSLSYETSIADSSSSVIFTKMLQKLDNYGKNSFLVLAVATVMDPRCKMMYIEYLSSKFSTRDCSLQFSTVLEAVRVLYDDYVASTPQQQADSSSDSDYTDTSESEKEDYPSKKRKAGISKPEVEGYENLENTKKEIPNHDQEEKNNPKKREEVISKSQQEGKYNIKSHLHGYQQFVQSTIRPPKSDLERYLGEPVLPWSLELNLLDWWKVASPKYPVLCKMARDVLSILLSSSDALFTEERKVDSRITSHGPALVNALMCVRSWLSKN